MQKHSMPHFADLDGVRGVLAILVMLHHFGFQVVIAKLTGGIITNPQFALAVDFFFILSGMVLARSYVRRPRSLSIRFAERVFRLLPVHIVLLLLVLPLALVGQAGNPIFDALRSGGPGPFLAELTGTYIYFYPGHARWNGPGWSINIELWLPVALAACMPFVTRMRKEALMALLVALLAMEGWLAFLLASGQDLLVARGLTGLCLGGAIFAVLDRQVAVMRSSRWQLPVGTGVFVLLMIVSDVVPVAAPVAVLLAVLLIVIGTGSSGILSLAPFQWVGGLSYTIYMVHMPLKFWTYYLLDTDSLGGDLLVKGVLIGAVFACAALLTRYVELPFMRLGKRVLTPKPPTALAA